MLQFAGLYLTFNFWMENDRIRFELVNIINYIWFHKILTRNSPNFLFIKTKKKSVKTKRRFPFHPSWFISFQTEIQCQWLKKWIEKFEKANENSNLHFPMFCRWRVLNTRDWPRTSFPWKKGPAIFSMIIDFLELLKRRGQEYFTLVLTKNYSNLVAALSYCSDEGN